MSIKQNIRNLVAPLYNKVWHGPKGKIKEQVKKPVTICPTSNALWSLPFFYRHLSL